MKFKTIAFMLSACFALFCFASCDLGLSKKEYVPTGEEYFSFSLTENGTYAISAKDVNNLPTQVNLPKEYEGKSVTEIAEDGFIGASITKVVVPEGYTVIGDMAFKDCASLKTVSLNSVKKIGNHAFYGCNVLSAVEFPTALEEIGGFAFSDTAVTTVKLVKVKTIGKYAFYGCKSLKNLYIPSTTVSIGDKAFDGVNAKINVEVSSANEYYKAEGNNVVSK